MRTTSHRVIHAAFVVDRIASPGLVPGSEAKRRLSCFVRKDELEAGFGGCKSTFPTEKLPIRSQKNLLNTPGQIVFDLTNEGGTFLPVQNISFPEFTPWFWPVNKSLRLVGQEIPFLDILPISL